MIFNGTQIDGVTGVKIDMNGANYDWFDVSPGSRRGKTQSMRDAILQRTAKEVTEFAVVHTERHSLGGPRPR